jgi:DNA-binding transcriptional ArsR family regulator
MVKLRFGPEDLLRFRFAVSPVAETILAVRAGAVADPRASLDVLRALCPRRGYTPAFLTPPPRRRVGAIHEELAEIRRTPARVARQQITRSLARREVADPVPHVLFGPGAVAAVADAVETAWSTGLAPRWREISEVLEGDLAYRERRLSRDGLAGVFADLSPMVWLDAHEISVLQPTTHITELRGRGLRLLPSAFIEPDVATAWDEPSGPSLIYAARGTGTLTGSRRPPAAAVRRLLGPTRAAILAAIEDPSSTTVLARRLGLSKGGVADHLKVLRDSGLAARSRAGLEVRYRQTPLARDLLAATAGEDGGG